MMNGKTDLFLQTVLDDAKKNKTKSCRGGNNCKTGRDKGGLEIAGVSVKECREQVFEV